MENNWPSRACKNHTATDRKKLSSTHEFNYIALRVTPGLTSCEELATALFIHHVLPKAWPFIMSFSHVKKQVAIFWGQYVVQNIWAKVIKIYFNPGFYLTFKLWHLLSTVLLLIITSFTHAYSFIIYSGMRIRSNYLTRSGDSQWHSLLGLRVTWQCFQ